MDTPRLAFPIRFEGDHFAETDQDTAEEVRDALEYVLTTRLGERAESPEFGIPDQLFAQRVDGEAVLGALQSWETRAETVVATIQDLDDTMHQQITIRATMTQGDEIPNG